VKDNVGIRQNFEADRNLCGLTVKTIKILNFGYPQFTHRWKIKPTTAPANSRDGCRSDPWVKNNTHTHTYRVGYLHPRVKLSSLGELRHSSILAFPFTGLQMGPMLRPLGAFKLLSSNYLHCTRLNPETDQLRSKPASEFIAYNNLVCSCSLLSKNQSTR
jgi:hypothetical protein